MDEKGAIRSPHLSRSDFCEDKSTEDQCNRDRGKSVIGETNDRVGGSTGGVRQFQSYSRLYGE